MAAITTTGIQPRLLRRRQAAAYLGVSLSAFDGLRRSTGLRQVTLPCVRGGAEHLRTPLFDVHDLDGLIERAKRQ